jgi:preprotein translocase subunit SecA
MSQLERTVLLSVMDAKWKDHLYLMDALREGIHLRAYGQRDPVVEYQREAYRMFEEMIASVKLESLTRLLRVQPVAAAEARPVSVFATTPQHAVHPEAPSLPTAQEMTQDMELARGPQPAARAASSARRPQASAPRQEPAVHHAGPKVGRNDPCPCGSGKKYKKCHGQ